MSEKAAVSSMPFHAGEIEVQAMAGVQVMAERIGRGIHAEMPPVAQAFMAAQRFAAAASVDGDGRVWASLLTGQPGFLEAVSPTLLRIHAAPAADDPLLENVTVNPEAGLVVIDFAKRHRVRINGRLEVEEAGLALHVRQAYSNCPKYIQARAPEKIANEGTPRSRRGETLTHEQQGRIARADTFFIGSYHQDGGADASHRGGTPGFVKVVDGALLIFPDYAGNMMFNTLGNLLANPRAGLLFVDFDAGRTLQLTGRAEIVWDDPEMAAFPGAERLIRFGVEGVIDTAEALSMRYGRVEASPFNPKG